jgi:hypothetical protein
MNVTTVRERSNTTHRIGPATSVPLVSVRRTGRTSPRHSIEGILIFSGIGLLLTALAVIFFGWLELPPPYF